MSIYTAISKTELDQFASDLFDAFKQDAASKGYTVTAEGVVGKRASDGVDMPDAALVSNWVEVSQNVEATTGFDFREEELPQEKVAIALAKNTHIKLKKKKGEVLNPIG